MASKEQKENYIVFTVEMDLLYPTQKDADRAGREMRLFYSRANVGSQVRKWKFKKLGKFLKEKEEQDNKIGRGVSEVVDQSITMHDHTNHKAKNKDGTECMGMKCLCGFVCKHKDVTSG